MADRRELSVGGKPISSLRVVDLKVELEKRSLPKSGSKKDLLERLRLHLQLEENREAALKDEEHVPNLSLCNETENDFIKEYLAAQQARFQVQREAKKQFEEKKRESEASAEETTQDEDESSEVSPSKKSPRKAIRPRKKEDSTSSPQTYKSSLEFQTPDSIPYSTPPQEKREEDSVQEDETTGEEEELKNMATPLARKHKLLKYVANKQTAGQSGAGTFSISDHIDKYQAEKSARSDSPTSEIQEEEAINLKVTKKSLSSVDNDSEEVLPRVVEVWSQKKDESACKDDKTVEKISDVPVVKDSPKKIKEASKEKEVEKESPKSKIKSKDELKKKVEEKTEPVSKDERDGVSLSKTMEPPITGFVPKIQTEVAEDVLMTKESTESDSKPEEKDAPKTQDLKVVAKEVETESKPVVKEIVQAVPLVKDALKTSPVVEPSTNESNLGKKKAAHAVPLVEDVSVTLPVMKEPLKTESKLVEKEVAQKVLVVEDALKTVPAVQEPSKTGSKLVEKEVSQKVPVVEGAPKTVPDAKEPLKTESPTAKTKILKADKKTAPVGEENCKTIATDQDVSKKSEAVIQPQVSTDLKEDDQTRSKTQVARSSTASCLDKDQTVKPKEKKDLSPLKVAVNDRKVVGKAMENKVRVHSSVGDVERSMGTSIDSSLKQDNIQDKLQAEKQELNVSEKTQGNEKYTTENKQNSLKPSSSKKSVMAAESETSSLLKPAIAKLPVNKVNPVEDVQEGEEEEDELQMESGETIDDSLKLNCTDMDDSRDQENQSRDNKRSHSNSRSRNSSGSENEGKSDLKDQSKAQEEARPQVNSIQVPNVGPLRKLKLKKSNTEVLGDEESKTDVGNGVAKKRKWGTSQLLPVKKPALVISTDLLKSIVPDARPLTVEEVRLGSPNPSVKETKDVTKASTSLVSHDEETRPEPMEPVRRVAERTEVSDSTGPVKQELVLAAAAPLLEATSPAQQPRASVLHVTNLVRPFTINQLKDLLVRTGNLVEGKFWIDKVKSSCLVQFETEEEAEETRAALHGIHWPTSNPKTLVVDYSTVEHLDIRLAGKEPSGVTSLSSKTASAPVQSNDGKRVDKADGRVREWDLGKTGETPSNAMQEDGYDASQMEEKVSKGKDETPAKLLDDLFRKTKTAPCIYWLPLTAQQIAEKQNMRRQRQLDRDQRISEMQQKKDHEFQQRQREREKERERQRNRERQRSRKRSHSSSSSSSSSASPNKRRNSSKSPPRKR